MPASKRNPPPCRSRPIPPHHAQVRLAQPGDIAEIFGKAEEKANFVIGYTREQGHPVVINMEKFVQRSSGVFGATGTGKSFLTRMVLAGLIHYDKASVLVFDMHNEYGFDDVASDTGKTVIGLRDQVWQPRCRWSGWAQGRPSAARRRISTWKSPCPRSARRISRC